MPSSPSNIIAPLLHASWRGPHPSAHPIWSAQCVAGDSRIIITALCGSVDSTLGCTTHTPLHLYLELCSGPVIVCSSWACDAVWNQVSPKLELSRPAGCLWGTAARRTVWCRRFCPGAARPSKPRRACAPSTRRACWRWAAWARLIPSFPSNIWKGNALIPF